MADILGRPYLEVCVAALIPAILYYLSTGGAIYFYASCRRILGEPRANLPSLKAVLKKEGQFLIALPVFTIPFFMVYNPSLGNETGLVRRWGAPPYVEIKDEN